MHVAKVAFLLVLTLLVMRAGSWLIGWMARRIAKRSRRISTIIGNGVALALFIGFLMWNLMPGEPIDIEATVFGVVVFGFYQLIDLKWVPWEETAAGRMNGAGMQRESDRKSF